MSGMKPTTASGGRHVQDGHYFYAKLSEKRSQIIEANEKLKKQMDDLAVARPRTLQMVARLNELSAELKSLETQLQEHNLVMQKATVHASAADLQADIAATQVHRSWPCPSPTRFSCAASLAPAQTLAAIACKHVRPLRDCNGACRRRPRMSSTSCEI